MIGLYIIERFSSYRASCSNLYIEYRLWEVDIIMDKKASAVVLFILTDDKVRTRKVDKFPLTRLSLQSCARQQYPEIISSSFMQVRSLKMVLQ